MKFAAAIVAAYLLVGAALMGVAALLGMIGMAMQ